MIKKKLLNEYLIHYKSIGSSVLNFEGSIIFTGSTAKEALESFYKKHPMRGAMQSFVVTRMNKV